MKKLKLRKAIFDTVIKEVCFMCKIDREVNSKYHDGQTPLPEAHVLV